MAGDLHGFWKPAQFIQRLMQDERVKAFLANPAAQEVMRDAEIQRLVASGNMAQLAAHPKFAALLRDPACADLMAKLTPQAFLSDAA